LKKPAEHFQRKSSAEKCTAKVPDEKRTVGGCFFWSWGAENQISVQAERGCFAGGDRPTNCHV